MLRRQAVSNQEAGQREFTSKDTACCLGIFPEELSLWTRLDLNDLYGVALVATLATQSDKAPAQYQFKHLSFQEGLYAQHLLQSVETTRGSGGGYEGWATDALAAAFLNNAYMNNVCRIASGHLGRLLARQRPAWDFSEHRLLWVGRSALWLLMDENDALRSLTMRHNAVVADDANGLARMLATCPGLQTLDLAATAIGALERSALARIARALGANTTLVQLGLASNALGPEGTAMLVHAMNACVSLRSLDLSYNQPGRELSLAELVKAHRALVTLHVTEEEPKHLDTRARDAIGRAMLANPHCALAYVHCDAFVLGESTATLRWRALTASDAILLAGALKTNTVVTELTLASSSELDDAAREALGTALLTNKHSRLGFVDEFGLSAEVTALEIDLKTDLKLKKPTAFRFLAGVLQANTKLEVLTLTALLEEHVAPLATALRTNRTLRRLTLIHVHKSHTAEIALPVQQLNGAKESARLQLSGELGRVSSTVVGALLSENSTLQVLSLSGCAFGSEGGAIFEHLACNQSNPRSALRTIDLSNVQLGERGGTKLCASLLQGAACIVNDLRLGSNDLRDEAGRGLIEVLRADGCPITSLDISCNALSGGLLARAIR